jgi:multidrug resistance efflux pump
VAGNFQEWLQEGESLYQAALKEYRAIEAQLDDLESKLVAKQAEVNQIAQVIGKPPVEANRRLTGGHHAMVPAGGIDIIEAPTERSPSVGSNASIARALTGKFGR